MRDLVSVFARGRAGFDGCSSVFLRADFSGYDPGAVGIVAVLRWPFGCEFTAAGGVGM